MARKQQSPRTPTIEELQEICPGKAIESYIEYSEITTEELARKLDIPIADLKNIINGNADLTMDVMRGLSKITKTSLDQWMEVKKHYERVLAKISENEGVKYQ